MVDGDGASAEVISPPAIAGPESRPVALPVSPERGRGLEEKTAANQLEQSLNQGADPEGLAKGFVEGFYEDDEGRTNEGKTAKYNNQKANNQQPEDNQQEGKDQGESENLGGIIESFNRGEITLEQFLAQYQKLTGLPALNLREDLRYKEMFDNATAEWDEQNPQPADNGEYSTWANQRLSYTEDQLPGIIDSQFQAAKPDLYEKYQKYSIYLSQDGKPSLFSDPEWKKMEKEARVKGTKYAGETGVLSHIEAQVNSALEEFYRRYPEKAKIYGLFDEGMRKAIARVEEKRNQERKARVNSGSSEDGLTSTQSRQGEIQQKNGEENPVDSDGNKKDLEAQEENKTPEQMIKELQDRIQKLETEIDGLRQVLGQLNQAAENTLREQGKLPSDYEQKKKENPYSALLLLLLLLGLNAAKEAAKEETK